MAGVLNLLLTEASTSAGIVRVYGPGQSGTDVIPSGTHTLTMTVIAGGGSGAVTSAPNSFGGAGGGGRYVKVFALTSANWGQTNHYNVADTRDGAKGPGQGDGSTGNNSQVVLGTFGTGVITATGGARGQKTGNGIGGTASGSGAAAGGTVTNGGAASNGNGGVSATGAAGGISGGSVPGTADGTTPGGGGAAVLNGTTDAGTGAGGQIIFAYG